MTREEAIRWLNDRKTKYLELTRRYPSSSQLMLTTQVIDMAIEALTHEIRTETHGVCSDLISRADAIEVLAQQLLLLFEANTESPYVNDDDMDEYRRLAEELFEDVPSADAVEGEWIDIDNYYRLATCSHCHKVTMFEKWGEYIKPYNFCPNCGAKMHKEGDSE